MNEIEMHDEHYRFKESDRKLLSKYGHMNDIVYHRFFNAIMVAQNLAYSRVIRPEIEIDIKELEVASATGDDVITHRVSLNTMAVRLIDAINSIWRMSQSKEMHPYLELFIQMFKGVSGKEVRRVNTMYVTYDEYLVFAQIQWLAEAFPTFASREWFMRQMSQYEQSWMQDRMQLIEHVQHSADKCGTMHHVHFDMIINPSIQQSENALDKVFDRMFVDEAMSRYYSELGVVDWIAKKDHTSNYGFVMHLVLLVKIDDSKIPVNDHILKLKNHVTQEWDQAVGLFLFGTIHSPLFNEGVYSPRHSNVFMRDDSFGAVFNTKQSIDRLVDGLVRPDLYSKAKLNPHGEPRYKTSNWLTDQE